MLRTDSIHSRREYVHSRERPTVRVCVDDKSPYIDVVYQNSRSTAVISRLPRHAEEVPRYNRAVFALRVATNKSRMTGIRLHFRWYLPPPFRDFAR